MKKRLLSTTMIGIMTMSAILATPMMTSARDMNTGANWYVSDNLEEVTTPNGYYSGSNSGMPMELSTSIEDDYDTYDSAGSYYSDAEKAAANVAVCHSNWYFFYGDTVTLQLPFSGTVSDYSFYNDTADRWSADFGTDSVTFTFIGEYPYDYLFIIFQYLFSQNKQPENNFWLVPMEDKLAIAASEVEINGGSAVARISGDYALPYDIMKYLDEHPGVTLEYTLTYEGNEYLIVIPGGSQLANVEIPWYGPKYLIKYFAQ